MKALTIRHPWAWAIARGHKTVENRRWTTPHRGPLAIHTALRWDELGEEALREVVSKVRAQGGELPKTFAHDLPASDVGVVIAVADLTDICTASLNTPRIECDCGLWAAAGQTHWRLQNVSLLPEPFKAKGKLGIWEVTR